MPRPQRLGPSDLGAFLDDGDKPKLLEFWANWCPPCLGLSVVIRELAYTLSDRLDVGRVNTDDHGDLALQFGVKRAPTLVLLVSNREVARLEGFQTLPSLIAWVNEHSGTPQA